MLWPAVIVGSIVIVAQMCFVMAMLLKGFLMALYRELRINCVTCSYIDKFVPFYNRMCAIHNIFVKYLQTIYLYKAEKIDSQCTTKFSIYRMSHMIFGVEKLIFG